MRIIGPNGLVVWVVPGKQGTGPVFMLDLSYNIFVFPGIARYRLPEITTP